MSTTINPHELRCRRMGRTLYILIAPLVRARTLLVSNTANDQVTMFDLEFQTLTLTGQWEKRRSVIVPATRRVHAVERRDRAADTSGVLS
jgi:hypothetical protein